MAEVGDEQQGVQLVPSSAAAADADEAVVTMLADHQAVVDVLTWPDGAISGFRRGSTSSPTLDVTYAGRLGR